MDKCYPVNGVKHDVDKFNKHIRKLLKSFLHYESRGGIKTDHNDPFNHFGRIKFISFLQHERRGIGTNRDIRFRFLEQRFLHQFANFAGNDTNKQFTDVKRALPAHYFSHLTDHANGNRHVPLTSLEQLVVCFRTLPCGPTNSMDVYRDNFWPIKHDGRRLAHGGKEWKRIIKMRQHRFFEQVNQFHLIALMNAHGHNNPSFTLKLLLNRFSKVDSIPNQPSDLKSINFIKEIHLHYRLMSFKIPSFREHYQMCLWSMHSMKMLRSTNWVVNNIVHDTQDWPVFPPRGDC